MRLQNNIIADNSHRQIGINTRNLSVNTEKLSSGYRVNRSADDAAGLAISEKMRTQIRGLNRASLNIQDGVSLLQVGDGALQSIHDKLQRLRELAVQSANDTNQLLDREALQLEFGQLASEMNQVVQAANFNGRLLFDGSMAPSWSYNLGKMTTPYVTTIPLGEFPAPPTEVNVQGWNGLNFGNTAVDPTHFVDGGFPSTGYFAMQIVTPGSGTLNVVIDFATENASGSMTRQEFLNYFNNKFNELSPGIIGSGGITYSPALQSIIFDFPKNNNTLTGVMGQPSTPGAPLMETWPWVIVGLGPGPATDPTASAMRDTLRGDGSSAFWSTDNIKSFIPPGMIINEFTNFANSSVFTSDSIFAMNPPATLEAGVFPNATITVTVGGTPTTTTIPFIPGNYKDVGAFLSANNTLFKNAGFDLNVDDEGKLIINRTGTSSDVGVAMTINPAALASALGFTGLAPGDATTALAPGKSIPIQSGANKGDMVEIGIPRLCTRSLGLSIRRPLDDGNPTGEGFEHINSRGADGYSTIANVASDPMEYSLDITTRENASAALGVLTNAINIISTERARIGAQQNRLEYAMKNVDNSAENLQAAESRIRDVDMAAEMTTFVQNQILQQSSTAMLAQANALPNSMLQLLG